MSDRSGPGRIVSTVPVPPAGEHRDLIWYGGTFDPPTVAHVDLPRHVLRAIDAWAVVYCPAARSPFKDTGPVASGDDRVAMLAAALGEREDAFVSRVEIDAETSGEPSYTVRTLERVRAELDEAGFSGRVRLLLGADQARSFHRWREPERIAELAEPLVVLRSENGTDDDWDAERSRLVRVLEDAWAGADRCPAWADDIVRAPVIDASATRARSVLASGGGDARGLVGLVPDAVRRVIRERGLYAE